MSKRKILVVDDEIGVRASLRMIFQDDYEILQAGNGEEALRILQETRPDVIILDIVMPNINGIAFLNEIQRIDRQLPVIVVSAIKDTAMGQEALKFGAFSYLTKPFDVTQLQQLVQSAVIQANSQEGLKMNRG